MNRADWQEEVAFIRDTMEGRLSLDAFNGDWSCFGRYCAMQCGGMLKAGHHDLFLVAQAYTNRAMRKFYRAASEVA